MIHLGVHNHLVAKLVEETKRLIAKEVDHTHDAKIFSISLSASKTFLANYLFDDSNDGKVELLKGEQLEHIWDKFCELSFPNVWNFIASFKRHSVGGYIDSILQLKSKCRNPSFGLATKAKEVARVRA
jgi:hypothetical protein